MKGVPSLCISVRCHELKYKKGLSSVLNLSLCVWFGERTNHNGINHIIISKITLKYVNY